MDKKLRRIEKILASKAWRWVSDWIETNRKRIEENRAQNVLLQKIDMQDYQIGEYKALIESQDEKIRSLEIDDENASKQIERLKLDIELLREELSYSAKIIARDRERLSAETAIYATMKTDHVAKYRPSDLGRIKDEALYGDE